MRFKPQKSKPADTSMRDGYADRRQMMVRDQIERRGVKDSRVLDAMRTVPRHRFVPSNHIREAYTDHALPIAAGQTISQPYIVALMTECLELQPSAKVLEIGTGCGYQTAVLAEIAAHVYTVEIITELAEAAKERLTHLGYRNVHAKVSNGYQGWEEHAPYDGIIVTAAPRQIPNRLIDQLAVGGRMILPVGDYYQELVLLRRTAQGIDQTELVGVRFVPMTGAEA